MKIYEPLMEFQHKLINKYGAKAPLIKEITVSAELFEQIKAEGYSMMTYHPANQYQMELSEVELGGIKIKREQF